MSVLKF